MCTGRAGPHMNITTVQPTATSESRGNHVRLCATHNVRVVHGDVLLAFDTHLHIFSDPAHDPAGVRQQGRPPSQFEFDRLDSCAVDERCESFSSAPTLRNYFPGTCLTRVLRFFIPSFVHLSAPTAVLLPSVTLSAVCHLVVHRYVYPQPPSPPHPDHSCRPPTWAPEHG